MLTSRRALGRRRSRLPASALGALLAAVTVVAEHGASASVRELTGPDDTATPRDPWPQAEAERPLTLPERATGLSASVAHFRATRGPTDPIFNPTTTAGVSAAHGLTDHWQLSFSLPRLYCQAAADPSGCDDGNRWNGTGVGVTWAPFGARREQLALRGGLSVRGRSPTVSVASLGVEGKLVPRSWLFFGGHAGATYGLNASSPTRELTDRLYVSALVGLQPTKPLYLWLSSDLSMHATISLGRGGGASWTFANHLELGASVWERSTVTSKAGSASFVPGWTYGAYLSVLLG